MTVENNSSQPRDTGKLTNFHYGTKNDRRTNDGPDNPDMNAASKKNK